MLRILVKPQVSMVWKHTSIGKSLTPVRFVAIGPIGSQQHQDLTWSINQRILVGKIMRIVEETEQFSEQASAKWIDNAAWGAYLTSFRRTLLKEPLKILDSDENIEALKLKLNEVEDLGRTDQFKLFDKTINNLVNHMFSLVIPKAEADLADVISAFKTLATVSDLRIPHEWYPKTRLMKRKIIYHGGPTNSGKVWYGIV
jgi:hypothetical protein